MAGRSLPSGVDPKPALLRGQPRWLGHPRPVLPATCHNLTVRNVIGRTYGIGTSASTSLVPSAGDI